MTKTITIADDVYEALKSLKEPGESFSDVARRLANAEKRRRLLQTAGAWKDVDTDKMIKDIYHWRDETLEPRYRP